jgi:hypothetical protein
VERINLNRFNGLSGRFETPEPSMAPAYFPPDIDQSNINESKRLTITSVQLRPEDGIIYTFEHYQLDDHSGSNKECGHR